MNSRAENQNAEKLTDATAPVELEDDELDGVSGGGLFGWLSDLLDRRQAPIVTKTTGRHTNPEAADDPSTAMANPPRPKPRPSPQ